MHVLYVVPDYPISPNAPGGGPVLFHNHLELFARCSHSVALVVAGNSDTPNGFDRFVLEQPEEWARVQSWVRSVHRVSFGSSTRATRTQRIAQALCDPAAFTHTALDPEAAHALERIASAESPDLLWAEHRSPAMLAWRAAQGAPIVYSHHDWGWKIARLRAARHRVGIRERARMLLLRSAETRLVREVAACASPSATEAEEIRRAGARHVAYLPAAYDPVSPTPVEPAATAPRIVHLGGMPTTANRVGLERFMEVVWPRISGPMAQPPEMWVVGSMRGASEGLLRRLELAGARCTGFVDDLATVLRPYDIHIIPWEHDTGTRTRLPLALNHCQMLIATRASVACVAEMESGTNCVLVDRLDQMADAVVRALGDPAWRKSIADAGRATFFSAFTVEALQPRFETFLRACAPHT